MGKGRLDGNFARERKNIIFGKKYSELLFTSLGAAIFGAIFLSSGIVSAATSTAKNDISVTVQGSCSVSSQSNDYSQTIDVGTVGEIGSGTVFDIYCNDEEGYVVYAVGNGKGESGEATEGLTDLIGATESNKIATGLLTSGDSSNWFFKLSNATSGMTIEDSFKENALIPSSRTKVVSRTAGTAASVGDTFTATYSAYIGKSQQPDTYSGGVKYILFHPSNVKPDGTRPSMQDFKCTLGDKETTTLLDTRDGNTYTVAKLADGKCWMTENLKIEGKILTSDDSDVVSPFTLPTSSTNGFSNYDVANVYVDNTYGGYYTWFAATAGDGKQSVSTYGQNVEHSICPKGWKLPTKAEFDNLVQRQSAVKMTQSPANFALSGRCSNDSLLYQQLGGYYWSSTAISNIAAYYLAVNNSNAITSNDAKNYGNSVRCVSRQ